MERGCGVLLHISSLDGNQGVGCFSEEAYKFVDFLQEAGMKYWQVLPFSPTSPKFGNSPYSPLSVFAGNPYFIDLTKYLTRGQLKKYKLNSTKNKIDYQNVHFNKTKALKDIYKAGYDKKMMDVFVGENKCWIDSYAQWMAKNDGEEKEFHVFVQMLFFEQWKLLKGYANKKGIQIIGDASIYACMDSADVWAYPEVFAFKDGKPDGVAGVPPDCFNSEGQMWGNPLYNFKQLKQDHFKWWCDRIANSQKMYDVLRIDHFRAFDTYYKIPYGEKTACNGRWCKGPGMKIFKAFNKAIPGLKLILEDFGGRSC